MARGQAVPPGLGSNLNRSDGNHSIIQRILRHSKISMTQAYYSKTSGNDVHVSPRTSACRSKFPRVVWRLTQCGGLRLPPGTLCRGERRRGGAGPCSLADIGKLSVDNFEHHGWAITLSCPFPSGGYASHQIGKPFASVSPQTLNLMRVQKRNSSGVFAWTGGQTCICHSRRRGCTRYLCSLGGVAQILFQS